MIKEDVRSINILINIDLLKLDKVNCKLKIKKQEQCLWNFVVSEAVEEKKEHISCTFNQRREKLEKVVKTNKIQLSSKQILVVADE